MTTKHTPTPWRINAELMPYRGTDQGIMTDRKYIADVVHGTRNMPEGTTPEEARANAAFIVRAVNAHDALVTALAESIALYESSALVVSGDRMRCGAWINSARDALALAKKD